MNSLIKIKSELKGKIRSLDLKKDNLKDKMTMKNFIKELEDKGKMISQLVKKKLIAD